MTAILAPASNFALAKITNTPLSKTDVSFVLTSVSVAGRFPAPGGVPYGAVVWPRSLYADWADAYAQGAAEIVLVTSRDAPGKTLTVTRAQQGTPAIDLNIVGADYWIRAGLTAKEWDDLDTHLWKNVGGAMTTDKPVSIAGSLSVTGSADTGSLSVGGSLVASSAGSFGGAVSGASASISGDVVATGRGIFSSDVSGASGHFRGDTKMAGPNPWIDVTASPYLADPTGVADSKAAIQAAITAAQSVVDAGGNGAVVFFPPGNYRLLTGLTCTGGVSLVGCGPRGGTSITYAGTDGGDAVTFYDSGVAEVAKWVAVHGIRFVGTGDESSGRCLLFHNCFGAKVSDCEITTFGGGSNTITARNAAVEFKQDAAATLKQSEFIAIRDCYIHANLGGGIRVGSSNTARIESCKINANNKYGVFIETSISVQVEGCSFFSYGRDINGVTDFSYAVIVGVGSDNVAINACRFATGDGDGTTYGVAVKTGWDGHGQAAETTINNSLSVSGCLFPTYEDFRCIEFAYTRGWSVDRNFFDYNGNTARYGIYLPSTGATSGSARVSGNVWGQSSGATIFPEANRILNTGTVPLAWHDNMPISGGEGPLIDMMAVSGQKIFRSMIPGDSSFRFEIETEGLMEWGVGSSVPDASLQRIAAGVLEIQDALQIGSGGPKLTFGTGAPAASDPNGSVYLRTDGAAGTTLYVRHSGTTWTALT